MKNIHVSSGMFWLMLAILLVAFKGEPDIVDAIVFKLTGVWATGCVTCW